MAMMIKNIKQWLLRQDWKRLFAVCLFLWCGVNIVQSLFTEMMSDEAYYALYGNNLAWGYYDHPPAVGVMTFASSLLFDGNLSVRFATVILQLFTIIIIWKLLDEKQPDANKLALFLVITASMVMFTAYGFITTPDVPFLFFTALFLLVYRRFLERKTWLDTMLLAVAMAGMMYSKYHAALLVVLVVLSHLKLLTRYKFWIAGVCALLLLTPHIWWQIEMDFPSFRYHLSGRSSSFRWKYFLEYIPNQLAVFNPLAFVAAIYVVVSRKACNVFERGLYFVLVGFVAFFWLTSFRGHVEPHWTAACTIPMIVVLYRYCLQNNKFKRIIVRWSALVVVLIIATRILLTTGCLPLRLDLHGKEERSKALQIIAGEQPVAFTGSFQRPSDYCFFTKHEAFALSSIYSRQTQFDIWQKELNYQGKPVFVCTDATNKRAQRYETEGYIFYGFTAERFQSVNRLRIDILHLDETDSRLNIHFSISNPTATDIDFNHDDFPVTFKLACATHQINLYDGSLNEDINILKAGESRSGCFHTLLPDLPAGSYRWAIALDNTVCVSNNSGYLPFEITAH